LRVERLVARALRADFQPHRHHHEEIWALHDLVRCA
jgi:hypothetical protein